MLGGSIARRYSRSLFEIAQERGNIDGQIAELDLVVKALNADPFAQFQFENKMISSADKKSAVNRVLEGKVSPITRNFLNLLIDKGREGHLKDIVAEFGRLADEAKGIVEVEVRTAVALPEAELNALKAGLSSNLGKTVRLSTRVDRELIGGVVVKIGDQLLDGSVRTRLQALKTRLAKA